MVTGLQNRHQCHGLRRHAGCRSNRGPPALKRGYPLFKGRHRGVTQPGVNIAEGLQVKERSGVLGAVKDKTGGLINGQGPSTGGSIGNLSGMDG